jgi:aspartate racemase
MLTSEHIRVMKTVGLIGGIAPESTIDYYRSIIASYRERRGDGTYPPILINSIDLTGMLALAGSGDRAGLTSLMITELDKLARAGATFAALASNTPHLVFDQVRQQSPLPLISIVESTCAAAQEMGVRKAGLLGTRFTMDGGFYAATFARAGIAVVTPAAEERAFVHEKYMGELVNAVFLDETREAFLRIVARMRRDEGVDAVILGGTELPLILRAAAAQPIPFLDTTRLHVEAIVTEMLRTEEG